jgi:hypothetical protein
MPPAKPQAAWRQFLMGSDCTLAVPNEHGQQSSMKAEPVGWPQLVQSRSQHLQQTSLSVMGV